MNVVSGGDECGMMMWEDVCVSDGDDVNGY